MKKDLEFAFTRAGYLFSVHQQIRCIYFALIKDINALLDLYSNWLGFLSVEHTQRKPATPTHAGA